MNEPDVILDMLGGPEGLVRGANPHRTLAVVGLSANPAKPSYSVSRYMKDHGYRILPVNPSIPSVFGEPSYPSLQDLPIAPDVVNVFRLPSFIPAIVDEMIALNLRNLWVQLGIVSDEAAAKAQAAGIRVVMDRCVLIEHRRLLREQTR